MSIGRILYYEHYDGLGILAYPYEPFYLAVVWNGKKVFARPIIELQSGECYFLYQGKKVNPYVFKLRVNEVAPEWAYRWIDDVINGVEIKIDVSNLADKHLQDFKSMIQRKSEIIQEWLLVK
ncbi:hypothetical protein GCM10027578_30130 [Spirosoma luteolum]